MKRRRITPEQREAAIEIGQKIKALREKYKLSQQDLSNMICVPQSTISTWEGGINIPNAFDIFRLAKCLNIDISMFEPESSIMKYKKNYEPENIREALIEMRKKMDQIENQLGMKGDIMIHQNNNHQTIGNVSVGKD